MPFSEALELLKKGRKIARKGWNGKNQFLKIAYMERCCCMDGIVLLDPKHDEIGSKFILFCGTSGYQCGWLASQADLLAEDWEEVKE